MASSSMQTYTSRRRKSMANKRTSNRNMPTPSHKNIYNAPKSSEDEELYIRGAWVNTSDFEGTILARRLREYDLEMLASSSFTPYLSDVSWFYNHATVKIDHTQVRGKRVVIKVRFGTKGVEGSRAVKFTDIEFQRQFGLPSDGGVHTYKCRNWPEYRDLPSFENTCINLNNAKLPLSEERLATGAYISNMTGTDKMISKIVREVLLPTNSHDNKLNRLHTMIVYLFKMGKEIDWPIMIGSHIKDAIENKNTSHFPYRGLITHIVRQWDPHHPSTKMREPRVIGLSTVKRSDMVIACGGIIHSSEVERLTDVERHAYYAAKQLLSERRELDEDEEEEPERASRGRRAPQQEVTLAQIWESQQAIIRNQETHSTDMADLREQMTRMETRFNEHWGGSSS